MPIFCYVLQSFTDYDEVPRAPTSYEDQEEAAETPPPLPPPRGASLAPLPTPIPPSASAQEILAMEARYNSENIARSRAADHERPLPPLPPITTDSLDEEDEDSANNSDTDSDEMDEVIDEASSIENGSDGDRNTRAQKAPLLNGNRENDDSNFDADSTLPPSPSKTSNTSGFNSISPSESPASPDSER